MTQNKQGTYANLAPLTVKQRLDITLATLEYFSAIGQKEVFETLGKPMPDGAIRPLPSTNLPQFLEIKGALQNADRYHESIRLLLDSLSAAGLLIEMGPGGTNVMLPKCYYFFKEFTTIQSKGYYGLAQSLGVDFLYHLAASNIVHITGTTESGDIHAGTGIIVSENAILTCAHVITDMTLDDKQNFLGSEVSILETRTHKSIDVGLLYIKDAKLSYNTMGLPFSEPIIGKELIILGYPKIPLARHAPLTMQRGEVTCEALSTFYGDEVFLFSAAARPGNSGGPILSSDGHFLGMVTRDLTYEDNSFSPHFAGVPTSQIAIAVQDLDHTLELPIENYQ